jgi:hypothetical protein
MIVAIAPYETTEPTVDSQIAKLQSAGADLLYDIAAAKFASQAIRKVAAIGWNPVYIPNGANITSRSAASSRPRVSRTPSDHQRQLRQGPWRSDVGRFHRAAARRGTDKVRRLSLGKT